MKYVLFVCTQNAGRSQIAQALWSRNGPDEAMQEVGIDLSRQRPKRLTLEMQLHADWGITLACGAKCPAS
jgi:arsenate reductase (thioredoxin)